VRTVTANQMTVELKSLGDEIRDREAHTRFALLSLLICGS